MSKDDADEVSDPTLSESLFGVLVPVRTGAGVWLLLALERLGEAMWGLLVDDQVERTPPEVAVDALGKGKAGALGLGRVGMEKLGVRASRRRRREGARGWKS